MPIVQRNMKNVLSGFVGCLKEMRQRGEAIGKWTKNFRNGVVPCSDKVEPGYFLVLTAALFWLQGGIWLDLTLTSQCKSNQGNE